MALLGCGALGGVFASRSMPLSDRYVERPRMQRDAAASRRPQGNFMTSRDLIELTTDIVASYVTRNRLAPGELPGLVSSIHQALKAPEPQRGPGVREPKPSAAGIRRSIRRDTLISFLDGLPYKQLKRHLTKYGLTPQQYRERFGLPVDYPMVSASYSAQRSAFAKAAGLGRTKRGKPKRT